MHDSAKMRIIQVLFFYCRVSVVVSFLTQEIFFSSVSTSLAYKLRIYHTQKQEKQKLCEIKS